MQIKKKNFLPFPLLISDWLLFSDFYHRSVYSKKNIICSNYLSLYFGVKVLGSFMVFFLVKNVRLYMINDYCLSKKSWPI